jgi:hypothetical protein
MIKDFLSKLGASVLSKISSVTPQIAGAITGILILVVLVLVIF